MSVSPAAKAIVECTKAPCTTPFHTLTITSTSPMGLYPQSGGGTSTFYQGQSATPSGEPAPTTSNCTTFTSASIFTALPTLLESSVTITNSATTPPTPTSTTDHVITASPTGTGISMWESLNRNTLFAILAVFLMSLSVAS